jgi:peptidyl-prolyl cis-trans isomerase C
MPVYALIIPLYQVIIQIKDKYRFINKELAMRKAGLILLVLIGVLFSVRCAFCEDSNAAAEVQKAAEPELLQDADQVVMVFDGNELTVGQLQYLSPRLTAKTAKEAADYWLDAQLFYEEAIRRGLDKDAKTKFTADMEYKKVFAKTLVERVVSKININDKQIKEYYDKNKDTDPSLKDPMFLSFSHVKVDELETAVKVLKRLQQGEDINELAKELSITYDAPEGGRVVKLNRNSVEVRYGKEFLDALLNATEGQIIGPLKSENGKYEIARHEGRLNPKVRDLDPALSGQIKAKLENEARNNIVEELLKKLRRDAKGRYAMKVAAGGEKKSE